MTIEPLILSNKEVYVLTGMFDRETMIGIENPFENRSDEEIDKGLDVMYEHWTYKLASLHNKGLHVTPYTDKKGKEMVRFQNRTVLKDKNGLNVIRRTKLPLAEVKQIDDVKRYVLSRKEILKDSLKLKTNILGYAAVGWDVINDTKENIENKASKTKIAGDIIGDAAIGIGSTAASALTGAAIGTVIGGPIGTVVGAGIGFGVSIGISWLTDGIKFNKGDWNHDGKQDSVKDRVKSGIGNVLDKIF
ncbi:bacteriocin class II family protein [Bacillus cereus]|uniref:bacteriocin class II family protein n=1 Tax=Bacillus cereus TaxID=1396 RepID=UPI0025A20D41|nr:bacteriocin class II family protein [Bacillus cereus]MDM5234838.1 bacteriocin class II family protein [Bacillus cereus]